MDDRIPAAVEPRAQHLEVAQIPLHELPRRMLPVRRDVPLLLCSWIEGNEVIENGDKKSVSEEGIDDVAADEAGASGDEDVGLIFGSQGYESTTAGGFSTRLHCIRAMSRLLWSRNWPIFPRQSPVFQRSRSRGSLAG